MELLLTVILPLIQSLLTNAPTLAKEIGEYMTKGEITDVDILKLKDHARNYDEL